MELRTALGLLALSVVALTYATYRICERLRVIAAALEELNSTDGPLHSMASSLEGLRAGLAPTAKELHDDNELEMGMPCGDPPEFLAGEIPVRFLNDISAGLAELGRSTLARDTDSAE